jgi:hypothetical protein
MKFLAFVKGPEIPMDKIPPQMFAVMDKYTQEQAAKGHFESGGGLAPSAQGFRVAIRGGKVVVTDGPFTESKEVIGGWAFLVYNSREEAIAGSREFMELHIKNWPGWEGTSEVRPLMDYPDEAPK